MNRKFAWGIGNDQRSLYPGNKFCLLDKCRSSVNFEGHSFQLKQFTLYFVYYRKIKPSNRYHNLNAQTHENLNLYVWIILGWNKDSIFSSTFVKNSIFKNLIELSVKNVYVYKKFIYRSKIVYYFLFEYSILFGIFSYFSDTHFASLYFLSENLYRKWVVNSIKKSFFASFE